MPKMPSGDQGTQHIEKIWQGFFREYLKIISIGTFTKDTRSIYVTSYKMPGAATHTQALAQMYEILWRHFSVWGDIEDLNVITTKGVSFVRYKHRC